jgi:3-oxoacyl-[acyl-carrier-protein] synthase III
VRSDLALEAAKESLKHARRKPEDVDLIILGTTSPDYITPDTAVVLQYKLGAKNAGTFDVGCACAAFPPMIAPSVSTMGRSQARDSLPPRLF